MLIASVLSILFFWLDKTDIALIFTFQVFISICAGSIFPLLWSMYADCGLLRTKNREPCHRIDLQFLVHEPEIRMGDRHGYHRLANLAFFGFQANTVQSEETISGIKMFLSFLPAVGTILSVVFIAFYPLSETKR